MSLLRRAKYDEQPNNSFDIHRFFTIEVLPPGTDVSSKYGDPRRPIIAEDYTYWIFKKHMCFADSESPIRDALDWGYRHTDPMTFAEQRAMTIWDPER